MKIIKIILIFILSELIAYADELDKHKENEKGLLFDPLVANSIEPRLGFINRLNTNNVRLDIGISYDLSRIKLNEYIDMAFGADFFTYTKLRKESDFKFPVETIDYLFGANFSLMYDSQESIFMYFLRIRLSHISAHIVDGLADSNIFIKTPFVYSREFFDICFALENENIRLYLGSDLIFHSIPDVFSLTNPHFGFELYYPLPNIKIIGGYDFKLTGIEKKIYPVHSAQVGATYSFSNSLGLFLGFYYYNGKSIHGMYYQDIDDYFGIGFQLIYK